MLRGFLFLALAGWLGCNGKEETCSFGDPDQPLQLELIYRTSAGTSAAVNDGGQVPLIEPPQGGKVVLVGARVNNVKGCRVQLNASLRDTCTNRIIALEERPVTLAEGADGWGEPSDPVSLNDFANVPACPASAAERDVEGEPYQLTVRVMDDAGRSAELSATVVPVCAEPESEMRCKCDCDGNYVLGDPCTAEIDGGPPPGTCTSNDGGV